ncbi:SKP1-like protein 11 [Vitis riparia]|uniref:SKP1-like protein 11 n=1 Tax=Vitis riparia TaxID=96939 RepID=UPI00155B3142|nr:SKP1-like protein 11 [Vitis riparia]
MAFTKKVTLKSSDGVLFIIDRAVALQSRTIQYVLEDTNPVDTIIPVPAVDARTLSKVLEYCKKHLIDLNTDFEEYSKWDKDFVDVEVWMLYDLIMAADYLHIPPLIDLICDKIASMFKGQTPEKIREIFNIENDFSKEEEEGFKKKSGWAFK